MWFGRGIRRTVASAPVASTRPSLWRQAAQAHAFLEVWDSTPAKSCWWSSLCGGLITAPMGALRHSVDRTEFSVDRLRHSVDRMEFSVDRMECPMDRSGHSVDRMEFPMDRLRHSVDRMDLSVDRSPNGLIFWIFCPNSMLLWMAGQDFRPMISALLCVVDCQHTKPQGVHHERHPQSSRTRTRQAGSGHQYLSARNRSQSRPVRQVSAISLTGYGSSSGYAQDRCYAQSWAKTPFRCY